MPDASGAKREKEIFERALDLNCAEERQRFLAETCGDDTALLARVQALLKASGEASRFLPDEPLQALTLPDTPVTEKAGDRIGHYKLLQQIGEGGCGVVYMAEQEEPVRRRVALKVIKLGMDTKSVIARFEAERQALALMDHPNIAKVLDAGATDTGRPYFVMELVRGVKITEFCDEAKLSTRERLNLFVQVCQAIQHAHQKGVIHRDIKPTNILVTVNDGVTVPKVIDFGIAKATAGRLTDKTLFTAFEQFMGTPAYMSPEQAVMTSVDIDTRSDIYSLGVLLYELLTGKTPFDASELLKAGLDEMRRTIREEEPARPSTRLSTLSGEELTTTAKRRGLEAPKLINQLRGDLDWIVMKCLEKDRARRYETANGLARDIEGHLNDEPVVARPPSVLYRLQKAYKRNKLLCAAGTAVLLALLGGLGLAGVGWRQAQLRRDQAVLAMTREEAQRREAEQAQGRAEAERQRAAAQELTARQRAYSSDINLAQQALAVNNLGRAQELLNRQRPNGKGDLDLRGWEWRYLWKQCETDAHFTLCQRSNSIFSLALSQDRRWLAIGEGEKGGVSVWDLTLRRQVAEFSTGNGRVLVAFSPQEPLLAICGGSAPLTAKPPDRIYLWDAITRKSIAELPLEGVFRGLAFSQDGRTLAASSAGEGDGPRAAGPSEITLWRVAERQKQATYPAPQEAKGVGIPFALAPDAGFAAHGMGQGRIRLVDLTNGHERWTAKSADEGWLESLALSPNGKILASSSGVTETSIRLWDVGTGRELGRLEGHRAYVRGLVFSPDGRTLVSASADQTIRLWDVADLAHLRPLGVLRGHRQEVGRVAMAADNRTLVSGCKDGTVYLWDAAASLRQRSNIVVPNQTTTWTPLQYWRFTFDSQAILTCNRSGLVARWQGHDFQEVTNLLELGSGTIYACLSQNQKLVAAGSTNGAIAVWDLHRRVQVVGGIGSTGSIFPITFCDEDKRLITVALGEQQVCEWDLTTWRKIRSWGLPGVHPGFLSPDQKWRIAFDDEGRALIGDMATGRETRADLQIRQTRDAAFSADNKLLAVASDFGFARLFDIAGNPPRQIATLGGFMLGVDSVAFSADGKRLATSSAGKEAIKLWDVGSQRELLTLEADGGMCFEAKFSPDGNILGTYTDTGKIELWRAPSWPEIEAAEAALAHNGGER